MVFSNTDDTKDKVTQEATEVKPMETENNPPTNADLTKSKPTPPADTATNVNNAVTKPVVPTEIAPTEDKANSENSNTQTTVAASEDKVIQFVVIYSKEKYDIKLSENSTVLQLKNHLESIIGVPQGLQKIMYKGMAKNEQTLKSLGVTNNTKIMLVGSKLNDVLNLATVPTAEEQKALQEEKVNKEAWCKQKMHKAVLDKGLPEDVMPGILNTKEPLPPVPLSGMLNKAGGKLRITFRLELDELWLGTKERTEKIRMSSIKSVLSEPIEGMEQYHIMALQLGTTDASRYWIYYVPAQYVDSIKHIIMDS